MTLGFKCCGNHSLLILRLMEKHYLGSHWTGCRHLNRYILRVHVIKEKSMQINNLPFSKWQLKLIVMI